MKHTLVHTFDTPTMTVLTTIANALTMLVNKGVPMDANEQAEFTKITNALTTLSTNLQTMATAAANAAAANKAAFDGVDAQLAALKGAGDPAVVAAAQAIEAAIAPLQTSVDATNAAIAQVNATTTADGTPS